MGKESLFHSVIDEHVWAKIDLPDRLWRTIQQESLGVITMSEFDKRVSESGMASETFLFCLDRPKGRMGKLGDYYGLIDWDKGLVKLKLPNDRAFSDLLSAYMQAVVESNSNIIFFLPPNVMSHESANVTRYELYLLLMPKNRSALKRTLFVYDEQFES